jgi:hypothetical protein
MEPKVHIFESTGEAYDNSQWRNDIKDGDLLIVPLEGVVGFLHDAWPVSLTNEAGEFHHFDGTNADVATFQMRYPMTIVMCKNAITMMNLEIDPFWE